VIDVKHLRDLRADIIDVPAAGVANRDLPLTPERVWRAIRHRARTQAPHETGVEAADASPLGSPR
jgi:hypothetical protein